MERWIAHRKKQLRISEERKEEGRLDETQLRKQQEEDRGRIRAMKEAEEERALKN
jgi:hypothetical protein